MSENQIKTEEKCLEMKKYKDNDERKGKVLINKKNFFGVNDPNFYHKQNIKRHNIKCIKKFKVNFKVCYNPETFSEGHSSLKVDHQKLFFCSINFS